LKQIKKMNRRPTYRISLAASVLLCIYLLNPFKLYLPYLDYQLNYNYIVNFLCENKDKPEIGCRGKCFLSKALKSQEKDKSQQQSNAKNHLVDELLVKSIVLEIKSTPLKEYNPVFVPDFTSSFPEKLSPPPKPAA
jgi:hypothetical protein